MKTFYSNALASLFLFCLTTANAQIDQNNLISTISGGTTSTNFYFARPNELTMIVSVMGFVQRPGRYEISSSIDLVNLISLAGGPTGEGSLSKVKIIRIIKDGEKAIRQDLEPDQKTLSMFLKKEEAIITRKEVYLDLENLKTVRPEDLQLMPGDVILIDRTDWSTVRDIVGVVTPALLVTTAIIQIMNAANR
jgi:protein involved in polysaccharide export with SLBB domain